MKTRSLSRAERKEQIILWFAIRIEKGNMQAATPYQIARGLGLVPSTKFNKILAELESEGLLSCDAIERPGRYPGKVYTLKEGTYQKPKKQHREITVNSSKGQLSLWME